jgi:hypothetical protein
MNTPPFMMFIYLCTGWQFSVFSMLQMTLHGFTFVLLARLFSVCVKALRHEGVWGSGCIDPHFLDLGTS